MTSPVLRRLIRSMCLVPAAALLFAGASPLVASADPTATPSFSRTTVVPLDRYHKETRIVRERSVGKEHVRFSAEAQAIAASAQVVFEIRSESKGRSVVRWRCTAVKNVSECFARPVKVRYLPKDQRVVLSVRVAPNLQDTFHYASH